ncbi:hypothetical protein B0H15DRAFT_945720 [Mycena belliarum]|uniref:Uncharacterized protein n=1 Tax=Mycena belliarum TaxID=1033014 RepID=A0AAD6UC87_9AGAR|nr:hypothetical protein B0H15DRAFT_945720 [Mycena belliae]
MVWSGDYINPQLLDAYSTFPFLPPTIPTALTIASLSVVQGACTLCTTLPQCRLPQTINAVVVSRAQYYGFYECLAWTTAIL